MLAVIAVIVGLHCFYWFSGGPDFGARYWYLVLIPCIVLAVRGLDVLSMLWQTRQTRRLADDDHLQDSVLDSQTRGALKSDGRSMP